VSPIGDAVTSQGELLTQHPNLQLVEVRCSACGATFDVRSTAATISVDVCSNCHPAYTGQERAVTSGGQIERFNRRRLLATV
jgi:large subunit ribosomal protein L31